LWAAAPSGSAMPPALWRPGSCRMSRRSQIGCVPRLIRSDDGRGSKERDMNKHERVVIVANRTPAAKSAGGLAAGLLDALRKERSLWFGWNGELREDDGNCVQLFSCDRLTVAAIPLTP